MADITRNVLVYLGIFLFSISPLLLAISAGTVGKWLGCQVNEGNAHPCICFGRDIGRLLYACFVMGWLSLITGPVGLALAIGYTVWLLF